MNLNGMIIYKNKDILLHLNFLIISDIFIILYNLNPDVYGVSGFRGHIEDLLTLKKM